MGGFVYLCLWRYDLNPHTKTQTLHSIRSSCALALRPSVVTNAVSSSLGCSRIQTMLFGSGERIHILKVALELINKMLALPLKELFIYFYSLCFSFVIISHDNMIQKIRDSEETGHWFHHDCDIQKF